MSHVARAAALGSPVGVSQTARSASEQRQADVAQYVADMILELRNLAKSAKLPRVLVPLEFAYYEAFSAANKVEVPPAELERLKRLSDLAAAMEAERNEPAL